MNDSVTLIAAQRKLSAIWFVGAVLIVLVVVLQAVNGFWVDTSKNGAGDNTVDALQWVFASVVPTSTLILGVLVAAEMNPVVRREFSHQRRSRFFLNLTLGICIFYLVVTSLFVLFATFRNSAAERTLLLKYSGFVLPVLQGLVSVAQGAFFFRTEEPKTSEADRGSHEAAAPEAQSAK